jgi:hypothetical protein
MSKHGDEQSTKSGQVNRQPGYCLVGILPVNNVFLNAIFPE